MMIFRQRSLLPSALIVLFATNLHAQNPYAVVFDFPNDSIPRTTCSADLKVIMQNLYPVYINNVISDSWWTTSVVNNLPYSYSGKRELSAAEDRADDQQQPDQRRMKTCTVAICKDVPAVVIALGCVKVCARRRHRNLRSTDNQAQQVSQVISQFDASQRGSSTNASPIGRSLERVLQWWSPSSKAWDPASYLSSTSSKCTWWTGCTNSNFMYPFNVSNVQQGWRGNYAPSRSQQVAQAFYTAVKTTASADCKPILLNMTYVLVDYD